MEIFCDQKVIHKLGASTKESYAKNLIYMAEKNMCESITYNGFNKNALVERVVAIMKFKKASVFALAFAVTLPIGIASVFATTNNILSQKEIAGLEDVVVETAEENLDIPVQSIEVISLKLKTKNIFSYIVNDQERTRSIKIDNYKYKDYGNIPPKTINMSVKNNGYTFKGTLTQTGYRYIDKKDKYIGYYSGTLYRSGAVKKPWALPKPTNFFEKKLDKKLHRKAMLSPEPGFAWFEPNQG